MLEGRGTVSRYEGVSPPGTVGVLRASGPPGWPPGQDPARRTYSPRYGYRPEANLAGGPGDERETVTTILGVVAALSSVMVFISSFLPWISSQGAQGVSTTGIQLMTANIEGFFMIRWGWGGILFTGFFGLVFGAVMLIPAILLLLNRRSGATWSIVTGVLGFFIALVNIIMVFSTYEGVKASAGLWLMLVFSVIVLLCGIIGMRFTASYAA
jgi:hypothetical protein